MLEVRSWAATVGRAGQRPASAKVNARVKVSAARPARRPYAATRAAGARILLVEDDDAIAAGLVRVLDSQGYEVRPRSRAAAARSAAARDADTGLVILDLGLPDIDGIDVCRSLRRARPDLAILILSARDQELDIVAGLDAGADDYLVKPFRLSELLARVRAHLRRGRARRRASAASRCAAGDVRGRLAARRAWRRRRRAGAAPEGVRPTGLLVARGGPGR